jgi:hypothetical protein
LRVGAFTRRADPRARARQMRERQDKLDQARAALARARRR